MSSPLCSWKSFVAMSQQKEWLPPTVLPELIRIVAEYFCTSSESRILKPVLLSLAHAWLCGVWCSILVGWNAAKEGRISRTEHARASPAADRHYSAVR